MLAPTGTSPCANFICAHGCHLSPLNAPLLFHKVLAITMLSSSCPLRLFLHRSGINAARLCRARSRRGPVLRPLRQPAIATAAATAHHTSWLLGRGEYYNYIYALGRPLDDHSHLEPACTPARAGKRRTNLKLGLRELLLPTARPGRH